MVGGTGMAHVNANLFKVTSMRRLLVPLLVFIAYCNQCIKIERLFEALQSQSRRITDPRFRGRCPSRSFRSGWGNMRRWRV